MTDKINEMFSENISDSEKVVLRKWIETNRPMQPKNFTIDGTDYILSVVLDGNELAGYKFIKPVSKN